jgi:hypothetical protein
VCCRDEQTAIDTDDDDGTKPKRMASFGRAGGYPMRNCSDCGRPVAFHWLQVHREQQGENA